MPTRRHNSGGGFTLVESLLAATILAMVVMAILMPFVAGAQNDQVSVRKSLAVALAEDLMEEILTKPFADPDGDGPAPGPDSGERQRQSFDNIDDYDGYVELPGRIDPFVQPIQDEPEIGTLSRRVEVRYVHLAGQDTGAAPTVCLVDVYVEDGGNEVVKLSRLVYANESDLADAPARTGLGGGDGGTSGRHDNGRRRRLNWPPWRTGWPAGLNLWR